MPPAGSQSKALAIGKSASAPAAPNPTATAGAQTSSNIGTAISQAALNNVDTTTPYGSTNYYVNGADTVGGPQGTYSVPTFAQVTNLTPLAQNILTGSEQTANSLIPTTQTLANQIGTAATTPLNFNTPDSAVLNQGPQLLDQNTTNAIYGQEASFLNPQWQQQQAQLQDQLSRQGIPVGSSAYDNAMQQFNNAQTQAYQSAQDTAIGQGTSAASNLFNMALSGQQQNIGQQQLAQSDPISLLQSLYGATPATPQQPISGAPQTAVSPTNTEAAQQLSTGTAEQNYQAQLQQQNATYGAVGSLAGTAALALALSDPRAKDIGGKTGDALGKLAQIPVSDARYKGEPATAARPMVMAPDVQRQVPGAVTGTPGGPDMQMVNFPGMLPLIIAGMQELDRRTARRAT